MAILFIAYIEAILYDILIFDVIKSKAPEFVSCSKSDCQFQYFKKILPYFSMFQYFNTPGELK